MRRWSSDSDAIVYNASPEIMRRLVNLRWLASTRIWLGLRPFRRGDDSWLTHFLGLNRSQSALCLLRAGGNLYRSFDLFFCISQALLSRQDQGQIHPRLDVGGIVLHGLAEHSLRFRMTSLLPA